MQNEYYFVYSEALLGVKTNIRDFKWVYGSVAPMVSKSEYEKCLVKFDISLKPEKELGDSFVSNKRFQSYSWDKEKGVLFCRRSFFSKLQIGYNVRIDGNTVFADIGRNYYRFVKNRVMNLHGVYYLLSDIANIVLLKNGFLTLYASGVDFQGRGVVCFAPPNTGKTLTATKLCETENCGLVGEDILISNGEKIYACPWTCSYRKDSSSADNGGAFGRTDRTDENTVSKECDLTNIFTLSIGDRRIQTEKESVFNEVSLLNGYLFNYYSSPIVKILGYFDEAFFKPWNEISNSMLKKMTDKYESCSIQTENPIDFFGLIAVRISGN